MKLQDKNVLVSGAGSGMGKAITRLFAKEGARVVAVDTDMARLNALLSELKAEKHTIYPFQCNVSDEKAVGDLFQFCKQQTGEVHILVNNAGILDDFTPADQLSTAKWNRVLGVNLYGAFYMIRVALSDMLVHQKGVILNIASIGGLFGTRAGAAYTASKHALIGLTKNTAFMYAQKGIRCNAIAPGGVNTHIADALIPNALGYERCMLGTPTMPRMGDPEEIARLALFLCSDDASLINGAVITADAGWSAY
ncbi:MAG: SDR family oxidoreductase [Bacteroidia bacterium]|jgi:NAD(P)-dependent dehydrogenase (short-subunit alcohol dehydrogenase family)